MIVPIDGIERGLNTKDRPGTLLVGQARVADNVRYYPKGVRRALPFRRVLNSLEREPAVLLDGKWHHFVVKEADTTSELALTSQPYTVEVYFKTLSLAGTQALFFKGNGQNVGATLTPAGIDWACYIDEDSGSWRVLAVFSDGTNPVKTIAKATDSDGDDIVPNQEYVAAVARGGGDWKLYLWKRGAASAGSAATLSTAGFTQANAGRWLTIGAEPTANGTRDYERSQYAFSGIIQEVRVWAVERSAADLAANDDIQMLGNEANLSVCYRLTGGGPYSWPDLAANAADAEIEPRDASWVAGLVGSWGLSFDGYNDGLSVGRSYLYRDQQVNEDGEFESHPSWLWFQAIKFSRVKDHQVVRHWAHMHEDLAYTNNMLAIPAAANDLNGQVTALNSSKAQAVLDVVKNPASANRHFRFAVWLYNVTAAAYEVWAVTNTSVNVTAGTTYHVSCLYDKANKQIILYVDGAATTQSTDTGPGDAKKMLRSDNDNPPYSAAQYRMELMRAIKSSRKGRASPGDPDDVDVQLDYSLCSAGALDQVGMVVNPTSPLFLAKYFAAAEMTRRNARSLGSEIVQCLPMEEGDGTDVKDIGTHGNNLFFRLDSGHSRGRSIVPTRNSARITGLFDYRRRSSAGEVRNSIAVQGGSVFKFSGGLDHSVTSLTHLADGIRNDDDNNVTGIPYLDGLIICTGSGNYHLFEDELYKLSIDPPQGFLGFGLVDQVLDSASLDPGLYRYAFTFLNEHTGKRSPVGIVIQVEWFKGKANVGFGAGIEINQTYPRTGLSVNSGPWDMLTQPPDTKVWLKLRSWFGRSATLSAGDPDEWQTGPGTSGPNTNEAPYAKLKFNKGEKDKPVTQIEELDDVQPDEAKYLIDAKPKSHCWARIGAEGKIEILGSYVGANAFLKIQNQNNGIDIVTEASGVWGFSGVVGPTEYQGTGTSDGPPLPYSDDPQVTHLEIWRTPAGGNDFFRLAKIENGRGTYVDSTPDSLLSGPVLDTNGGPPPACRYVFEFDGRAVYFGNRLNPQRIWFSQRGEPWNVPPQNVVDLVSGESRTIRMVAATEGMLIMANQDTFFVLLPSENPDFPFDIQRRSMDVGADSFFSAVAADEKVFWLAEKGIYGYAGSFPKYASENIEPSLRAVAFQNRDKVVAAHLRSEETAFWFAPISGQQVNGAVVPDGGFTWSYRMGGQDGRPGGFARLTGTYVSLATVLPDASEQNTIYLVDPFGYVSALGDGEAYGPDTAKVTTETTAVAASASPSELKVLKLAHADYPDGHKGLSVTVVDDDGTRETRYVIADDLASPNSALTLNEALSFTPATGDTVIFGSIESDWLSDELEVGGGQETVQVNRVHVSSVAKGGADRDYQVGLASSEGFDADDVERLQSWSKSKTSEWSTDLMGRGRSHAIRIRARGTDRDFEVIGLALEVEGGDRGTIREPT